MALPHFLTFAQMTPAQRVACMRQRPNWLPGVFAHYQFQTRPDGSLTGVCYPIDLGDLGDALGRHEGVSRADIVGVYHSAIMHLAPERKS